VFSARLGLKKQVKNSAPPCFGHGLGLKVTQKQPYRHHFDAAGAKNKLKTANAKLFFDLYSPADRPNRPSPDRSPTVPRPFPSHSAQFGLKNNFKISPRRKPTICLALHRPRPFGAAGTEQTIIYLHYLHFLVLL
jgi:hypothetical protein